jgi:hypothetical protein
MGQVIVNRDIKHFGKSLHGMFAITSAHHYRQRTGHPGRMNVADAVPDHWRHRQVDTTLLCDLEK